MLNRTIITIMVLVLCMGYFAYGDVIDPNYATATVVDTFHMQNASASELTAHAATYGDPNYSNQDYYWTPQELIDDEALRAGTYPYTMHFGSVGLSVRGMSSTQTIAGWSMSTGGYGAGDYILRLGGVLSNSTTRQGYIYLLGETTREIFILNGDDKSGRVDIAFTLTEEDISDGMITFQLEGYSSTTAYENVYIDLSTYAGSTANGGAGATLAYVAPEPTTLGLFSVGAVLALVRRRRK